MVEIAEMPGRMLCFVNNAPWISTPEEQKSDFSFHWALHIYCIFDQKLLSFEIHLQVLLFSLIALVQNWLQKL